MTYIQPGKSRVQIMDNLSDVRIEIPTKKNWGFIIFISFWLIMWTVGEVTVLATLIYDIFMLNPGKPSSMHYGQNIRILWLVLWTLGGGWTLYILIWQLIGKEIITINSQRLKIGKNMLPSFMYKEYDTNSVTKLRVIEQENNLLNKYGFDPAGIFGGVIVFDYGYKTYRFGTGLDNPESELVVNTLKRFTPKSST